MKINYFINNIQQLFTEVEVNSGGYLFTEVNNCFSISITQEE